MRIETNPKTIQQWIEDKQFNEQSMLKRLNELFGNAVSLGKMRVVVLTPLRQMLAEMRSQSFGSWAQRAMMAENNLAVWQTLPNPTPVLDVRLERMIRRLEAGQGDANDLSELIRVIGAWLEMGGGFGSVGINKAYRVGVEHIPQSAPHGQGLALKQQQAIDEQVWAKNVREREAIKTGPDKKQHEIEPHLKPVWVAPKSDKLSGMQMFRVKGKDLCLRIDNLFGLLKGATISGTTTDTALVLEAYGAALGLHAGYYLFPVATIAASLHHTLLEAGLALTLVEAISTYRPGFYTSLIPKGGLPAELAEAGEILRGAEDAPRNRHFILWYQGTVPAGCILMERPAEIEAFKDLADGRKLLANVRQLPEYPNRQQVLDFVGMMAPRLLEATAAVVAPGHVSQMGAKFGKMVKRV